MSASLLTPSSSNNISSVPQLLPSPPSSPTEEDLGGSTLWRRDSVEALNSYAHANGSIKGKERAREISLDDGGESDGEVTPTLNGGYPPLKDEEEESRKIQENLKRLEEAERQRRKAAREAAAAVAPGSVVADVSRRASLLFSSRRNSNSGRSTTRRGSAGSRPGVHHVHSQLGQSSEDALPLSELHISSNTLVSPPGSKPPSPTARAANGLPVPPIAENPFEPPDSATPLRGFDEREEDGDEMSGSAVMRPSSPPPPTPPRATSSSPFDDGAAGRATLQASSSFSRPHHPAPPPPLPLDLPPPKTPPPRIDTPGLSTPIVTSPPKRVTGPSTTRRENDGTSNASNDQSDAEEHRWWTDWLCGCREDKDRDNAGRTNPFE